jgi:hypothetical protein
LDGRWIDLSTATAFPGWGTAYSHQSYWDDEGLYRLILDNLCFHVCKYLGLPRSRAGELAEHSTAAYGACLKDEIELGFCALAGFCMGDIRRSARQDAVRALGRRVRTLSRQGYAYPQSIEPEEVHKFGGLGLATILEQLASLQAARDWQSVPASRAEVDPGLLETYTVVWTEAFEQARKRGATRAGFSRLVALNAAKVGQSRDYFAGAQLARRVSAILESAESQDDCVEKVSNFFWDVESVASGLYGDNQATRSLLWRSGNEALFFDAEHCKLVVAPTRSNGSEPATFESCSSAHPLAVRASEFWHSSVWRKACDPCDIR